MFQPIIPTGGYAGWQFLSRTLGSQLEAHGTSVVQQRDTDYFREKIGAIATPEALVADRRLLSVALGAFGLDEDINNKFFIQKVLSDGYSDPKALGNKLSDKSYLALTKAFGFGEGVLPRTGLSTFSEEIISAYKVRQFEIDVGNQNENMRLALGAKRMLTDIAAKSSGNDTKWYQIMGNPPLRNVFESALGLPKSFGALDVEKQLETFKSISERRFGTSDLSEFGETQIQEKLIRLFLLRADVEAGASGSTPGSIALQLLGGRG